MSGSLPDRNSDTDTYGADYYSEPFTNTEYSKTLQSLNVDRFIYDLINKNADAQKNNKPLISSAKSLPFKYEGYTVLRDITLIQNLSVSPGQGMDTPQDFTEPGYLISFRVAVNDPTMALKVYAKGQGETGFTIADYSMQKMAALGMGMTLGEAEEPIYNDEGVTSRDVSGLPSTDNPYLVRYKHLPTGIETDYEKYKGTFDDIWIVAAYSPKIIPMFNSLFFDIYNSDPVGTRLIHYLEINRLVIIQDRMEDKVPPYNKSILSLPLPPETPTVETATSSYTKGTLKKITTNPFLTNPSKNIYSIDKESQHDPLFKDIMDVNHEMFEDLLKYKIQEAKRLKRV